MQSLNAFEKSQIEAAKTITAAQLHAAKDLHAAHFSGNVNPEILAAIIQALATNHAVIAASSNR